MPKKNQLALADKILEQTKLEAQNEPVIIEEIEPMTMAQYQYEKNILAERRKQAVLKLDGRKLDQANRVMDAMDVILCRMFNPETTNMDLNFLANAYDKLNKTMSTIVRLDSVDGSGKAQRLALEVQFGNGTSVKTVVEG